MPAGLPPTTLGPRETIQCELTPPPGGASISWTSIARNVTVLARLGCGRTRGAGGRFQPCYGSIAVSTASKCRCSSARVYFGDTDTISSAQVIRRSG
jgi:hypothetical protein